MATIRYTNLGAPGSIPFRTGEKDLKKGQKRRLFFFLATGKFAQNPVGRSARPPLGIRAALLISPGLTRTRCGQPERGPGHTNRRSKLREGTK